MPIMKVYGHGLTELDWLVITTGEVTNQMMSVGRTAQEYEWEFIITRSMTQSGTITHARTRKDLFAKSDSYYFTTKTMLAMCVETQNPFSEFQLKETFEKLFIVIH